MENLDPGPTFCSLPCIWMCTNLLIMFWYWLWWADIDYCEQFICSKRQWFWCTVILLTCPSAPLLVVIFVDWDCRCCYIFVCHFVDLFISPHQVGVPCSFQFVMVDNGWIVAIWGSVNYYVWILYKYLLLMREMVKKIHSRWLETVSLLFSREQNYFLNKRAVNICFIYQLKMFLTSSSLSFIKILEPKFAIFIAGTFSLWL